MRVCKTFLAPLVVLVIAMGSVGPFSAELAGDKPWARVTEDDRAIKIETDKLEAVIPKKNPKHWMTGSDEAWRDKVFAKDGHGVGRYTWYTNETDPPRREYARMAHGSSHRKRMI